MTGARVQSRCRGCGTVVDASVGFGFACPQRGEGDVEHILVPTWSPEQWDRGDGDNPFVRFREVLTAYQLARALGLDDAVYVELATQLNEAVAQVDGSGFEITPLSRCTDLEASLGLSSSVWIKDETGNVSGSHKARHLAAVMLLLMVVERAGSPLADGLRGRRLAIASCGNAALAAAVVARAADWPIDVFIPVDAEAAVVARLTDLGANLVICARQPAETGDPCVSSFRRAVRDGSLPFSVQGPDNAISVEGGLTLGCELMAGLASQNETLDSVFVQVGGGALASSIYAAFAWIHQGGQLPQLPRLYTVQTEGAYPLQRAMERVQARLGSVPVDQVLAAVSQHRSDYMWPWEETPSSVAHGILDDETYDWLALVEGMLRTGGESLVVSESRLHEANVLGRRESGIRACHTGTSGLAGLMKYLASGRDPGHTAVIFSGVHRQGS